MAISTKEEIIKWAEDTKAGNGTTFTALSKADQFAIAVFVLETEAWLKKILDPTLKTETLPEDNGQEAVKDGGDGNPTPCSFGVQGLGFMDEGEESESESPAGSNTAEVAVPQVTPDANLPSEPIAQLVSRRDTLRDCTAQEAYDMFLDYCRENPTAATVMDFSNGEMQPAAAFAFWLTAQIALVLCEKKPM